MTTVTKSDIIDRIADQTDQKRTTVKQTVQCLLDSLILEMCRGNRVELRDFGVFEPRLRQARVVNNPKTLEQVEIPAKRVVKFKAGRLMRKSLEDPSAAKRALGVEGNTPNGQVVSMRDRTASRRASHR